MNRQPFGFAFASHSNGRTPESERSARQKTQLAEAITRAVMDVLDYCEESVSVSMEEVEPQEWLEKVYKPDIVNKPKQLYKKPGYDPSELP
jgi:4-oxalocrotonate tautomerase